MVKIIAITGGKGGTGKSTVSVALAYELSKTNKVLLVDADVDCPDDHLLLGIKRTHLKNIKQRIPKINFDLCKKCGNCGRVCKTKAMVSVTDREPMFIQQQCNGCGACMIACNHDAISWDYKEIGNLSTAKKGNITLLSGELNASQPVSEFIVNSLNEEIERTQNDYDYIIIDTAAGTHCPVIAALEKAEKIIAVTEPTPLGAHDLDVILQLIDTLKLDAEIVINRSGIGEDSLIQDLAQKHNSKVIAKIPYSKEIAQAYAKGQPIANENISKIVLSIEVDK